MVLNFKKFVFEFWTEYERHTVFTHLYYLIFLHIYIVCMILNFQENIFVEFWSEYEWRRLAIVEKVLTLLACMRSLR